LKTHELARNLYAEILPVQINQVEMPKNSG